MTKKRIVILALLGVVSAGAIGFGYRYYLSLQHVLPPGIVFANGRIEADEIAIAAKYPSRVAEIKFEEGDLVSAGQVLARMDTKELEASERAAAAQVAQRTKDRDAANSVVSQKQSELELAITELKRATALVAKDAISQQRVDQLATLQKTTEGALAAAESQAAAAQSAVASAESERERLQHMIDDATLTAPKPGRILYKLAEVGETIPAGGSVATLLDLGEVYMTVFLRSQDAARVPLKASGRIVVDAARDRPIPGIVSFVSPRAQFTPKQVETQEERERMMFRVKVRIPSPLVVQHIEKIKTGVTGVAYVKIDPKAEWPSWLESDLTSAAASASEER